MVQRRSIGEREHCRQMAAPVRLREVLVDGVWLIHPRKVCGIPLGRFELLGAS